MDKAQKTLTAMQRLDTTGEGKVSDAVHKAQLVVERNQDVQRHGIPRERSR